MPSAYPGYLRKVYPGFLQHAGFVAMNPDRHMNSHWDYYHHLVKGDWTTSRAHRDFYDEYNAVIDLPAEYYLDTIKIVFQEHLLPQGHMVRARRAGRARGHHDGRRCSRSRASSTTSPATARPRPRTTCARAFRRRSKQHLTAEGAGHYGIFSGRRWREQIAPQIRGFIRATRLSASRASVAR